MADTPNRHESILAAAERLVHTSGLSAATVRAVAHEAGIGASTLRHYFPTQRDLFEAVAVRLHHGVISDMRMYDTTVDPVTRLTECLMQFLPPTDDDLVLLAPYIDTLSAAFGSQANTTLRSAYGEQSAATTVQMREWLEHLAVEGRLKGSVEQQLLTVNAIVDGLAVQLLTGQGSVTVPQARTSMERLLTTVIS